MTSLQFEIPRVLHTFDCVQTDVVAVEAGESFTYVLRTDKKYSIITKYDHHFAELGRITIEGSAFSLSVDTNQLFVTTHVNNGASLYTLNDKLIILKQSRLQPETNDLTIRRCAYSNSSNSSNASTTSIYLYGKTSGNLPNHIGNTMSSGYSLFIVKLNPEDHSIIWTIQRMISGSLNPCSLIANNDNIVVSACQSNDLLVSMYDKDGHLVWNQTYGSENRDQDPFLLFQNNSIYMIALTNNVIDDKYEFLCMELEQSTGKTMTVFQFGHIENGRIQDVSAHHNFIYLLCDTNIDPYLQDELYKNMQVLIAIDPYQKTWSHMKMNESSTSFMLSSTSFDCQVWCENNVYSLQPMIDLDNKPHLLITQQDYSITFQTELTMTPALEHYLNRGCTLRVFTDIENVHGKEGEQGIVTKQNQDSEEQQEGVAQQQEGVAQQQEGVAQQKEGVAQQQEGVAHQNARQENARQQKSEQEEEVDTSLHHTWTFPTKNTSAYQVDLLDSKGMIVQSYRYQLYANQIHRTVKLIDPDVQMTVTLFSNQTFIHPRISVSNAFKIGEPIHCIATIPIESSHIETIKALWYNEDMSQLSIDSSVHFDPLDTDLASGKVVIDLPQDAALLYAPVIKYVELCAEYYVDNLEHHVRTVIPIIIENDKEFLSKIAIAGLSLVTTITVTAVAIYANKKKRIK